MNTESLHTYDLMLAELNQVKGKGNAIERRFPICLTYWSALQDKVSQYDFKSEEEEITFFKIIKPKFVAQLIYCSLLYYASLFAQSVNDVAKLERFWAHEDNRLKKFKEEHFQFWNYYVSSHTHSDTEWFTRRNNHHPYIRITPAYDFEPRASSSHDVLVSNLLALQLYNLYVAGQFALLQQICSAET